MKLQVSESFEDLVARNTVHALSISEGSPDDVAFSIEVLRPSAEALFAERSESFKRSPSKELKESESQDENGNGTDSSNLTHSTNSVNRSAQYFINLYFRLASPLCCFYCTNL